METPSQQSIALDFSQLGKIHITTGIKSLRVYYAATATQVERMQATKFIRDLTIVNRIVGFIRGQQILNFYFFFLH